MNLRRLAPNSLQLQRSLSSFAVTVVFLLSLISCGGGGASGGPPPPPPPPAADFSLLVSAPNISVQQQGAYAAQAIAAKTVNGFSGIIHLTLSGLPAGVTTLPGNVPDLSPTGLIQDSPFQLVASSTAVVGNATITVTGTSGSVSHSATFSLAVLPAAPFSIQVSPLPISMTPGSTVTAQVSVNASPGTSPTLSITTSSLPQNSGTTLNLPEPLSTLTTPGRLVLQAGVLAQPVQNFPIVITATDTVNPNNSSVSVVPLTVSIPFSSSTVPTRSTFIRTDQSPTGVVYDQMRKLLFVSIEVLNEVDVLSSIDGHLVARIPVFFPAGIDESADGSAVYVVSPSSSFITTIDPVRLEVIHQTTIPNNQIGIEIATLANGNVLILPSSPDVAASPYFMWNPKTDVITPYGQVSFYTINQGMTRSADHSKVMFIGASSSGGTVVLYDVSTSSFGAATTINGDVPILLSPDGSKLLGGSHIYDDQFNVLGTYNGGAGWPIYSLDGSHVYFLPTDTPNVPYEVAAVLDTKTLSVVGVVPSFSFGTSLPFSGLFPRAFAIDETNMVFGGAFSGMGFLDANSPGFLQLPLSNGDHVSPTLLSLSASTPLQISGVFSPTQTYDFYFGAPPASPLTSKGTNVSIQSGNTIAVSAPAGIAPGGAANVTLVRSDGFFQVMPDAVSYGPTVLKVDADSGSPAGGDSITIYGYGFESNGKVLIGGTAATNLQLNGPFGGSPLQRLTLTTPPGSPGDADVTVETSKGSAKLSAGFQYLGSSQIYPVAGALDDLAYDQGRQRLYITNEDHNRVEIFDLGSHTYLTPVSVGNLPTALALTPDATMLAVISLGDGTVSVIDLGSLKVTATYPVLTAADVTCGGRAIGISSVKPHRMLIDVNCTSLLVTGKLHLVNLDTGSLSCSGVGGCLADGVSIGFGSGLVAMASIPDGSKIFLGDTSGINDIPVGMLDLNSNTLTTGYHYTCQDAAASSDGNVFAASFSIANAQLSRINNMAFESYTDAGPKSISNVVGEKLNSSGSLLFSPQETGVDVFDVHTGRLVRHVAMPETIPLATNAMVLDETGTKMFLISNTGITIAQLFEAPLSLAGVTPTKGASGTQVTLRGSGFQNGATVTFGALQANVVYVDQNTLKATVPTSPIGPAQVTVRNPDGHAYSFDAAFTVQ